MPARDLALASLVLLAACGGGSASPVAGSPPVTLPDGDYILSVYSTGLTCVMVTYGSAAAPNVSVGVPVRLAADGDRWHAASRDPARGSVQLTLARNHTAVTGTASGTLTPEGTSVTLQHQISGTATASDGIIGSVEGTVNYASAGGTAFCSTNLWSLKPE
jgi:multidrug efflux pump subunit AcrA (membrane-fusion protein)